MSQYNENDPNRPLDSTPSEPLTGGGAPPPPAPDTGSAPPPPPVFAQDPGADIGPSADTQPPPPPGGAIPGLAAGPASTPGAPTSGIPGAPAGGSLTAPTADERNWAMFAHISAIVVGLLASAVGATFMGFLGPLVIYLIKKDESAFVADQAKEALNFYITVGIAMLALILASFTIILLIITVPLMLVIGIGALVLSIIASIKASNGELYRYPFTLRLIN